MQDGERAKYGAEIIKKLSKELFAEYGKGFTKTNLYTFYSFYELKRSDGDNPTIGIVLCADTDEDIARYSVLNGNEQLFASKYKLYLPTEEELRAEIEAQKTIIFGILLVPGRAVCRRCHQPFPVKYKSNFA